MQISITSITGFADAFATMYISKRTWTPDLDKEIRDVCDRVLNSKTSLTPIEDKEKFDSWLTMLLKIGKRHITLLRFIDISITTVGLHRAGQDDVDAHARRFDNRIIRNSTRLATFGQDEFSDYYKDKVITTDTMMRNLYVEVPDKVYECSNGCFYTHNDYISFLEDEEIEDSFKDLVSVWVKTPNGYVKEEYKDNKDVLRGLYMLGIPSNFISKVNLCEWGHIFQERNKDGGANPEVKEWAELVTQAITEQFPQITRDYILSIKN